MWSRSLNHLSVSSSILFFISFQSSPIIFLSASSSLSVGFSVSRYIHRNLHYLFTCISIHPYNAWLCYNQCRCVGFFPPVIRRLVCQLVLIVWDSRFSRRRVLWRPQFSGTFYLDVSYILTDVPGSYCLKHQGRLSDLFCRLFNDSLSVTQTM
jgi:hypothetical protein